MAIESCEECGNLFHKTVKDICPKCVQKEEEDFKKVRMYLKRNKTVQLTDVSKETEVNLELIYRFLQEGRITLGSGSVISYPCKKCSAPIYESSLCIACTDNLREIQHSLNAATVNETKETVVAKKERKGAFYSKS